MNDYYLHVELLIKEKDKVEFEKAVAKFIDERSFDRIDPDSRKKLVLALRSKETFPYDGFEGYQPSVENDFRQDRRARSGSLQNSTFVREQAPVPHRRYVHVWDVEGQQELDLARLMKLCADDDIYLEVDSLVVREAQNFVTQIPWLRSTNPLPSPPIETTVVRVTRHLATRDLGSFLFSLGGLLPFLEEDKLHLLNYFQNVTGTLNTLTEFWTTEGADQSQLLKALEPLLRPTNEITADVNKKLMLKAAKQRRLNVVTKPHLVAHVHEIYETYRLIGKPLSAS